MYFLCLGHFGTFKNIFQIEIHSQISFLQSQNGGKEIISIF